MIERDGVDKTLAKAPQHIYRKYQLWLDMMRDHGPEAIREWRGFKDHALKGEWAGYRASRLSKLYRVIYRIERLRIMVIVEKIDPHRYR